jgi:hypothetical protein
VSPNIYNDSTYLAKNPEWHAKDSDWKAHHLYSLLDESKSILMRSPSIGIAEVGCGVGGVLASLVSRLQARGIACEAVGYDISAWAIAEASRRHPNLRFINRDFLAGTEIYDLGLIVDVLEHMENPRPFLASAASRFRHMLLHIPLDENWFGRAYYRGAYIEYLKEDRGHLHYFTKKSALTLLRDSSLKIKRYKYTFWGVELQESGGGRIASLLRVFRGIGFRVCPGWAVRVLGGASLACLCATQAASDKDKT